MRARYTPEVGKLCSLITSKRLRYIKIRATWCSTTRPTRICFWIMHARHSQRHHSKASIAWSQERPSMEGSINFIPNNNSSSKTGLIVCINSNSWCCSHSHNSIWFRINPSSSINIIIVNLSILGHKLQCKGCIVLWHLPQVTIPATKYFWCLGEVQPAPD